MPRPSKTKRKRISIPSRRLVNRHAGRDERRQFPPGKREEILHHFPFFGEARPSFQTDVPYVGTCTEPRRTQSVPRGRSKFPLCALYPCGKMRKLLLFSFDVEKRSGFQSRPKKKAPRGFALAVNPGGTGSPSRRRPEMRPLNAKSAPGTAWSVLLWG